MMESLFETIAGIIRIIIIIIIVQTMESVIETIKGKFLSLRKAPYGNDDSDEYIYDDDNIDDDNNDDDNNDDGGDNNKC